MDALHVKLAHSMIIDDRCSGAYKKKLILQRVHLKGF